MKIVIDVSKLYVGTAKIADLPTMTAGAKWEAGLGNDVVLTGPGPVWLYLNIAAALFWRAKTITYTSPASGDVPVTLEAATVGVL